jgi:hypothetical protein
LASFEGTMMVGGKRAILIKFHFALSFVYVFVSNEQVLKQRLSGASPLISA